MKPLVTVIDYGIGNIFSIANALSYCGSEMVLTDSPKEVANAERLILPGVGAFENGMHNLRKRHLVESIIEFARTGRPFLGICLGMQMMLDVSEEFGEHEGLGLIPGRVVPIPSEGVNGRQHKIPHIGWNSLFPVSEHMEWTGTILANIDPGTDVYFIHSFTAVPEKEKYRLADTFYDGQRLSAVIGKNEIYGCQFHPEKSGEQGLSILQSFLRI